MTPAEALAACQAIVRGVDPDRYLATLFAPADKRPLLYALYALNHELARVVEVAHEPRAAEIRLQWWWDAIEAARQGKPRATPIEIGLSEVFSRGSLDGAPVQALIDMRETEVSSTPFDTLAAMESHADATSAALMRAAARVLKASGETAELATEAGIAYGLAGMLRSVPFHAARGKLFLPLDLLSDEHLSASDALSGKHKATVKRVVDRVALRAFNRFARAGKIPIPRAALPVVLPATLVPAYLSRLAKNPDPLRRPAEFSQVRRQLILLRAAVRRRL